MAGPCSPSTPLTTSLTVPSPPCTNSASTPPRAASRPISIAWPRWSVCTTVRSRRLSDRKSTRLNSSHANISYAVFCLKKKQLARLDHCRITHGLYFYIDVHIDRSPLKENFRKSQTDDEPGNNPDFSPQQAAENAGRCH